MCDKVTYESFGEAQKALLGFKKGRNYSRRKTSSKKPKRAYKCEICGKYHLTSQKKKHRERNYKKNTDETYT